MNIDDKKERQDWLDILSGRKLACDDQQQREVEHIRATFIWHEAETMTKKKQDNVIDLQQERSWKKLQQRMQQEQAETQVIVKKPNYAKKYWFPFVAGLAACLLVVMIFPLMIPPNNKIEDELILKSCPVIYMTHEVKNPVAYATTLQQSFEKLNLQITQENATDGVIYMSIKLQDKNNEIAKIKKVFQQYNMDLSNCTNYGIQIVPIN